jgi:hypothetical protein
MVSGIVPKIDLQGPGFGRVFADLVKDFPRFCRLQSQRSADAAAG